MLCATCNSRKGIRCHRSTCEALGDTGLDVFELANNFAETLNYIFPLNLELKKLAKCSVKKDECENAKNSFSQSELELRLIETNIMLCIE